MSVSAHIIEPAGFPVSDRHFRRAGMDYLDQVTIMRHDSWSKFEQWRNDKGYRLILFTTKAAASYLDYRYGAMTSCCSGANPPVFPTTSSRRPTRGW